MDLILHIFELYNFLVESFVTVASLKMSINRML